MGGGLEAKWENFPKSLFFIRASPGENLFTRRYNLLIEKSCAHVLYKQVINFDLNSVPAQCGNSQIYIDIYILDDSHIAREQILGQN